MSLSLLLDEMVEHEVMHRLRKFGHDVEHVDLHDELTKGDSDRRLARYSLDTGRIVVTYDSDWAENLDESEFHCVLLFADETMSARNVSAVVHNMSNAYPKSSFTGLQKTGREWLGFDT
jgi:predicted nuclease of predicted toxin-antitoxin system